MRRRGSWTIIVNHTAVIALAWGASIALGQPAAEVADADTEELQARVIQVAGSVKKAPLGVGPTEAGWEPVQLDDLLSSGMQIKTGFRSSVVLEFGPDTVVQIRKATLASIDDFYKSATEKNILLGLGYGTVRGGSTEADLRTDVVVDSTVATLAKRGTEGWQMAVDPSTNRFRISLARAGLVEAFVKATQDRRIIRPNEYADNKNIKVLWVNQDIFNRQVSFYEGASVTPAESQFAAENPGGTGVVSPDAAQSTQITKRIDPSFVAQQQGLTEAASTGRTTIIPPPLFRIRPEGDFGLRPTFGGLFGLLDSPSAKHRGGDVRVLRPNSAPRDTAVFVGRRR